MARRYNPGFKARSHTESHKSSGWQALLHKWFISHMAIFIYFVHVVSTKTIDLFNQFGEDDEEIVITAIYTACFGGGRHCSKSFMSYLICT